MRNKREWERIEIMEDRDLEARGPIGERVKDRLCSIAKKIVKFIAYKWVLPLEYKWYARRPIDEKLVVFADHRDRAMPDNFVGLYEMCKRDGYRCEFFSGRSFSKELPKWQRRREKVKFHFQVIRSYAQCRVLFLVEYFPLADIVTPRQGTQVVQLWHGCGIMKRVGYAVTSGSWGMSAREMKRYPMHTSYTLVCISSKGEKVKNGYQEAFRCDPNIIKPLGSPRTDVYFDEAFQKCVKEKVCSLFPEIGGRKIVLYAPTFRGESISRSYIKLDLDFANLKEKLSDRYVIVTKFHPLMAEGGLSECDRRQGSGFVFDVSKILLPEEALCAADILITDYSSIIFEYLLLERPIVSFVPDIDEYIEDRGMFFPYDQLAPGPYASTQEELVEKLLTVEDWFDIEKTRRYRQEFMSACDGHSTQRIYDYVFHRRPEAGGLPQ